MQVPPDGCIVDAGTKGNLRLFYTNLINNTQHNVHKPHLMILPQISTCGGVEYLEEQLTCARVLALT